MTRVLVTRPGAEARAVAEALAAQRHVAVLAPVLAIVPLPFADPPPPADAVLVTSQHAVDGQAPGAFAGLAPLPCFAVGQASAAAARRAGFRDVRVGAGDGPALADLLRLAPPPGRRLLHLAGATRKAELARLLAEAGFALQVIETYAAEPVPRWAETVQRAAGPAGFSACLHFSRRSATLALEGSRATPIGQSFANALHLCLSEDVAEPLRHAGLVRLAIADRPNLASLLQALPSRVGNGS